MRTPRPLALLLVLFFPPPDAAAFEFSLDAGSPSVSTPDEIDAIASFFPDEGVDGFPFGFSVDRTSTGAPGSAVSGEAAQGQAAADLFWSNGDGINRLRNNQDELGFLPSVPAGTPATPPIDDVDGFSRRSTTVGLSLVAGNSLGFSGADIVDPSFSLISSASDLGLTSDDDIDGLQGSFGNAPLSIDDNVYYFSLAPGSPSLTGDYSPADIFISALDGSFQRYSSAADLGLLATDNVDALGALPEAGSLTLMVLGVGALAWGRRLGCSRQR